MNDFDRVLEQLELSDSAVRALSNLLNDELAQLAAFWPQLSTQRRRALVARMVENAEADFELDFSQVFTMGLHDRDPLVRVSCIEGLWENEDFALIRPLARLLGEDESVLVREAAAVSLSRFALLAELGKLQPRYVDLVWDALWNAVHRAHEDLAVCRRAVESIAYFSRPEVKTIIEQAYRHDEPKMQVSAVFAMGHSADQAWVDVVQEELDSPDAEIRYEAVRACGALHVAEAIPALSRLAADADAQVRVMAVWALGQIGGPEATRVLEICCGQGDEALREAADEALAEMDFMQGALDFSMYDFAPALDDEDDLEADDNIEYLC